MVPHDSFPADCSLCHEGDDWTSIRADFEFDHGLETGVELVGAHRQAECLRCHNDRGPVQDFSQRGCSGCHEDVHLRQLGVQCGDCHDATDWTPRGLISDHATTRFPLVGVHAAVACWRCHVGAEVGQFKGASVQCAGCHAADFNAALNPDHVASGFSQDCEQCHLPTGWTGANFLHPLFALSGGHAIDDCNACHSVGTFAGLSSQCFSCHAADYNGASDPNHVALGISMECQDCHNTSTWEGATFSHVGVVNGCAQCHQTDYNATTDPNHAVAGFPTSCESCHNTNSWNGALFDHSFPITTGDHKQLDCTDCHLNPGNFAQFSCTHCHEHNQSDMAKKHNRVGGYQWTTAACYACHMNGKR